MPDLDTRAPIGRIEWRRARHAATADEAPPVPAFGAPVYHCYRFESVKHNPVYDAEGTVMLRTPSSGRGWRANPWHQFQEHTWLSAEEALGWLGDRLRELAGKLGHPDRVGAQTLLDVLDGCRAQLSSLQSACQIAVDLPHQGTAAFAIVASWDRSAIHPWLVGLAARPRQEVR